MIDRIRFIWQLLVLASILALLGIAIVPRLDVEISSTAFLLTLASVTIVNLVTYLVMYAGIQKENRESMVYLLGGIGIKFLLYLLFIFLL